MQSFFFPRRIVSSFYAFGSTSKSYFSLQLSGLCTMNRSSSPWSSNQSRHHQNPQDDSSISANAKYSTSCTGSPQPRRIGDSNISRNSQTAPIVVSFDEESFPDLSSSCKKEISRTKRATPATTSSEYAIGHYGRAPVTGSPGQPYNPTGSPQPRRIGDSNISRNSQTAPIVVSFDEESFPGLSSSCKKEISRTKRATPATTSSEYAIGHYGRAPVVGSPGQPYNPLCATETVSTVGPLKSGSDIVMEHNSPERSENVIPHHGSTSPKSEYGLMGHGSPERSNNSISQPGKTPQMRENSCSNSDCNDYKPFDICLMHKTHVLKPSLHYQNREKRKNRERSLNDTQSTLLRSGMVLLKNFITPDDQIEIIKRCRDLGLRPGGFYQPGFSDGAKLHLHMMCLGKDWDPQRRSYGKFRSIDCAKPPIIPAEFKKLVCDSLQASYATMRDSTINPAKAIPWMEPDICIVNFYTTSGKLGLHQDRDESPESIKNGLPVVSFSIGDSAEFLYGDGRDVDKASKIVLESGDVVIFGGKSRNVFHGVPNIIPKSAPKFLAGDANLRPGRLNLTFRQY